LGTDELNKSNNLRHSKIRLEIRIAAEDEVPLQVSWNRKIMNIFELCEENNQ